MKKPTDLPKGNALVSIIVLTYNSAAYIGRALRSISLQTYSKHEVIVVDNGSTDSTQRIVESFSGAAWLSLPRSDMGMARNYGVKHSHGVYLMFLDSDDFYLAHKLESQVSVMAANPELGVLFSTAYIYCNHELPKMRIKAVTRKKFTILEFLKGDCYTLATVCIRRSTWDSGLSFSEGELGRYGEDWRFQLNLAQKGVAFELLDTPTVVVEVREDSHTSWEIQPKMKSLALNTVEKLLQSSKGVKLDAQIAQNILDAYRFKLALSLILTGRTAEARIIRRDICSPTKSLAIGMLVVLSVILPAAWIRWLLEIVWIKHQENTFQWSSPPQNIGAQISALIDEHWHADPVCTS